MRSPIRFLSLSLIALAVPVVAQQAMPSPTAKSDASLVTAGSYAIDPGHSQVLFAYRHMGLTQNMGLLTASKGTLTIDPANLLAAALSVTVPVSTLRTGVTALDEHLAKPDFFDTAKFPEATFVSKSVKPSGTVAEVAGDLTIHGVTKPVVLTVTFDAVGPNPMSKKETISFKATTRIRRSDFGMGMGVPLVGDDVDLSITAAFEKQ